MRPSCWTPARLSPVRGRGQPRRPGAPEPASRRDRCEHRARSSDCSGAVTTTADPRRGNRSRRHADRLRATRLAVRRGRRQPRRPGASPAPRSRATPGVEVVEADALAPAARRRRGRRRPLLAAHPPPRAGRRRRRPCARCDASRAAAWSSTTSGAGCCPSRQRAVTVMALGRSHVTRADGIISARELLHPARARRAPRRGRADAALAIAPGGCRAS